MTRKVTLSVACHCYMCEHDDDPKYDTHLFSSRFLCSGISLQSRSEGEGVVSVHTAVVSSRWWDVKPFNRFGLMKHFDILIFV